MGWAPLAVSYVSGREATFRAANVKAQGTVLGTVYGFLGCFVFERFLSLLPSFIFTSFLQRSQMYGPVGAISTVIGAVLILGRKNYGPPSEFVIARIVETFIGLPCSTLVDLILGPKRTSTCAKMELSECLGTLGESIGSLSVFAGESDLEEKLMSLRNLLWKQKWNLIFGFYRLIVFVIIRFWGHCQEWFGERGFKFLQQEFHRCGTHEKEDVKMLNAKVEDVREFIWSSIKNVEEIRRMKRVVMLNQESQGAWF